MKTVMRNNGAALRVGTIFALCVLVTAAVAVLSSCEGLFAGATGARRGALEVTITPALSASSTFPATDITTVTDYELTATGPDAQSVTWSGTETTTTLADLEPGDWTIAVDGRNTHGTLIAGGSTTVAVESGSTATATVTLTLATGDGTVEISLDWPAGIFTAPSATAALEALPGGGTTTPTIDSLDSTGLIASVSNVSAGAHRLTIRITDEGTERAVPMEVVWVYPDSSTTVSLTLDAIDIDSPPAAPGELTLAPTAPNSVDLTWTDNSAVETGYRVMRKLSAEGTFSELIELSPGTTSYEDTGATTSDTYEYYIESFNAFGTTQSATQSVQLDRIDDISFTDTALAQGVSDHATAQGWAWIDEMTSLTAQNVGITQLDGIASLTALTTLDLSGNQIVDVTPLTAMEQLVSVNLADNQITTGVADLVTLTNATTIDLSGAGNIGIPTADLDTLEAALGTGIVIRPPLTYTVTYNANGADGGTAPADQTKIEGTDLTLAENSGGLALTDNAFVGWNTQPDGSGTAYAAGGTYSAEANVTLYAEWALTYTVTYDANGADGGIVPADQTKIEGTDLTLATNSGGLTLTDHSFAGWNTQPDGSGTAYGAGGTYAADADVTLYAQWGYAIGDAGPAGGLIFYVDVANDHAWTYLEAAPATTEWTSKVWGGYGTEVGAGAQGTAVGTGAANTAAIVAAYGEAEPYEGKTDYAAKLADDLSHNGYDDWFLPSKDELGLMYVNLHSETVGGFASYGYWSSSEGSSSDAWGQYFNFGGQGYNYKSGSRRVRAVRAFNN